MPSIEDAGVAPRAISGVDTVVAFVGAAPDGPAAAAQIAGLADFEAAFGSCAEAGELGAAVSLFYANGGGALWIAPSLAALEAVLPVDLLALPGEGDAAALAAAVAWADAHEALVIIEPPASVTTAAAAQAWLAGTQALRSRSAAAYFPGVIAEGATALTANAGAVAGVIVREERERGVWKAPAGAAATLQGVSQLAAALNDAELQALNAEGINGLRTLPQGGAVVWGARTLSQDNDDWKYVPVRRLAIYVERSVTEGLQWVVFEPNGPDLWAAVRDSVGLFLGGLFRAGAFMGVKASEAYLVRCDQTTMTQTDIDQGRLILEIGFAPLRPAEFVVLQIGLSTATAS